MKKCTVIVPVYNEKGSIKEFLHSLYHQSRKPDEIIVVDGNSTDGTLEILEAEEGAEKTILASFPCNIAQARNYAIKHAKHEIILCTDAGCIVDHKRCEELMKVYEHTSEQVVGGKSEYIVKTEFQRLAKHRIASPDPNHHFFSSRNISFHKKVWEKVGGYPEYLTKWGEDTYFNYKIEKAGYTIHYCSVAIVKWGMGSSFKDFYKMYRNYTQGDAEVFMIHQVVQSGSIKETLKFSIFVVFLIWAMMMFKKIALAILILAVIGIGLYKRSGGGFLFDLRFSVAKMTGMIVGLVKGIFSGRRIKSKKKI